MLAHTNNLGYDPTMHMCNPACKGLHADLQENAIGWIENHDKSHLSIMSTSDGMEYALKDCWIAEDKKNHEVTILKMVEGIPNVVKLVAHWDVLYDGEPDCMYHIRASHGVCTSGFIRRFHWCLLLTPCGEPLVYYSSKLELLRAFHDFVSAHSLMLASHVLHGDLSPNNFIIHDGQGYFIDFDHARIIAEGAVSVPSEGTGTRPYMSICLLREGIAKGATIQHTASDDLESLFFIFVEFVTTFDGPRSFMKDEGRRPLWVDKFETSGADPWLAKQGYVLAPHNDSSLMEKTTSFFTPFSQIIQEWHHLILAAASDLSDPSVGVTHAVLMALLKKWISQLPVDAPTEIMVPMASSSRLGHPPHDDVQSSVGAHHSTCIQQRVS
ncbi:kinase-like domain-containing protein [Suillus subaureus]|uniref:Kinase-like domain-containing protein n=1 Tax=Suillus subaureus TaxID=48587 RepID=A0A9P7DQM0_9AGAM|nr:kinase-like domain-containing protein [Suillus subaureus]KAG1800603.1 kinase-like domain-containing protein [Suillus subaureus]